MIWMFVSPPPFPKSYIEILMPGMMVLVGRAFGRQWLGHEDGTLMNGISAFIKEAPESFLVPSSM